MICITNDQQVQSQGRNPTKQPASLTTWPAATSQILPDNTFKSEPWRNWYGTHHTKRWTQPIPCATHSYVECGIDTLFLNPRGAPTYLIWEQSASKQSLIKIISLWIERTQHVAYQLNAWKHFFHPSTPHLSNEVWQSFRHDSLNRSLDPRV